MDSSRAKRAARSAWVARASRASTAAPRTWAALLPGSHIVDPPGQDHSLGEAPRTLLELVFDVKTREARAQGWPRGPAATAASAVQGRVEAASKVNSERS